MAPQKFYRWDANFVIQAESIHRRAPPNLSEVFARAEPESRPLVLRARHGQISDTDQNRRQTLTFIDGSSYEIGAADNAPDTAGPVVTPDRVTRFDRLVYRVQRPPSDALSKRRALTTLELATATEPKDVAEFQWRLCMPVISFLVALMAIELGRLRPKQSPYARFTLAIVLYALVFNLSSITTSAVENGLLPPFPGVYTAVLVMLGGYLVLRRIPRLTLRVPA
jgi:lipopolysaccharide export system permease protein